MGSNLVSGRASSTCSEIITKTVPSGTEHPWVSIVVKSLRLGALADSFKRFPLIGEIFKTVFPGLLKKLIEDTRRHEANTMDLVQKYVAHLQSPRCVLQADVS
jgi:hypothetical protein